MMLIFPLKKEWYEKIKSGEKTIEYREVKPYWRERLIKYFQLDTDEMYDIGDAYIYSEKNPRAVCKLRLGYTKKYMTARIIRIEVVNGKDTDLHIDKPVYAIHLADVKEITEKMPRLTKREWFLVRCACGCLYVSLDITNGDIKDRNPDIYKENKKDMKTLDRIMAKIKEIDK